MPIFDSKYPVCTLTDIKYRITFFSGQYNGVRKPNVSAHIIVNSFADKVVAQRSLRRPKLVTIRGDDGNEYRYLVKTGEDLRY